MWRRYTPYTRRFFEPVIRTATPHLREEQSEEKLCGVQPPTGCLQIEQHLRAVAQFQTDCPSLVESDHCRRRKRSLLQRQLPAQFGKELCAQLGFANDKRACGAHVHGIVDAQFFGEHARTKSPVPSNVDTPEENDQRHAAHCCSTEVSRRSGSG